MISKPEQNERACPPLNAYPPIHDYALVGDCRTGALVSSRGSIDWLCLPRFDSPSCFNRLLDWEHGGYWEVQPTGFFRTKRAYQDHTAVLVTEFETIDGRAQLTDLMPVAADGGQPGPLPLRQVLRRVEGLEGTVEFSFRIKLRPDDGQTRPSFEQRGRAGYCADFGGRMVFLAVDRPMEIGPGLLSGRGVVSRGETLTLWLVYAEEAPAIYPRLSEAVEAIAETHAYWTAWSRSCRYDGAWRDHAIRSAITLKLLSYAPSGAIVAAPTTSLPERFGGDLNWDYRYCWLRDASYTAHAFFRLGFDAEALAFTQWMTHATTLTYPELQVMYTLHGEASIPERSWSLFEGYRRSQPVRMGNAASAQEQLDVYGEVLEALALYVDAGYPVDRDTKRWIVEVGNLLSMSWPYPDHGIWEIRGEPRHYVHSKVMCWTALDRVERLARRLGVRPSTAAWAQAREALTRAILKSGYSKTRRSFVQVLGGTRLDAAALTFGLTGFVDARDPWMMSTIATIQRWLTRGPLVYRYIAEQATGREEGAFLPCSFWLVEALAAAGRSEEAEDLLTRLVPHANDLGLFPEEIRHQDGAFLGNFPLALTHVAHLGALLRLADKA
ncbi:MAG TPA: glycoside hydrolase family 15 protein [Nitrospira sp.]|nr:glycoside hydrolase family 15 protein [Nitrospira sp.]